MTIKLVRKLKTKFSNQGISSKLAILFGVCSTILLLINYLCITAMFYRNASENIISSNQAAVQQLGNNVNRSFSTIMRSLAQLRVEVQAESRSLTEKDSPQDYTDNYNTYASFFNRMVAESDNYPMIDSMQIINANQDIYVFSGSGSRTSSSILLFEDLRNYLGGSEYLWCYVTGNETEEGERLLSVLTSVKRFGNIYSIIAINLNEAYLQKYFASNYVEGVTFFYSVESGSFYAVPNNEILIEKGIRQAVSKFGHNDWVIHDGNLTIRQRLQVNNWYILSTIPMERIIVGSMDISYPIALLFGSSIIVAALTGVYISHSVTSPLKKLINLMRQVSQYKLSTRFAPKYQDEIGILASTYDQMMDEIVKLTERIRDEQNQRQVIYMKLLQMQIKPHFLHNSLETTRFMIEMKDPKAVVMIQALSRFYELMLGSMAEYTTVEAEMIQIQSYLTIMSIRYSSRFTYTLDVNPEVSSCQTIRFLLQPILENAIYHGVKSTRRPGIIRIAIDQEGSDLIMSIWDNGKGMTSDFVSELRQRMNQSDYLGKGVSIGLASVHQRLRLAYGDTYGVELKSIYGDHTEVVLRQPKILFSEGKENVSTDGG